MLTILVVDILSVQTPSYRTPEDNFRIKWGLNEGPSAPAGYIMCEPRREPYHDVLWLALSG